MTSQFNFRAYIEGIERVHAIARGEAVVVRLDRLTPDQREQARRMADAGG